MFRNGQVHAHLDQVPGRVIVAVQVFVGEHFVFVVQNEVAVQPELQLRVGEGGYGLVDSVGQSFELVWPERESWFSLDVSGSETVERARTGVAYLFDKCIIENCQRESHRHSAAIEQTNYLLMK